uniref:Uncharacterized protein n=1 Tax=Oryza brachyantha TaxID=4533 RepID=J3MAN9_ORYBR
MRSILINYFLLYRVFLDHPNHTRQLGPPASAENPLDFSGVDVRLPMLVYVSREKRTKHNRQKKAGAMNALMRASTMLSNARARRAPEANLRRHRLPLPPHHTLQLRAAKDQRRRALLPQPRQDVRQEQVPEVRAGDGQADGTAGDHSGEGEARGLALA